MTLRGYLRRLVWLGMLPVLLLAAVLAIQSVQQARAEDEHLAGHLGRQVAYEVEKNLRSRIDTLVVLADSPLLQSPQRLADFHVEARAFRTNFGSELILADAQGRMLLHSGVPLGETLPLLPRPGDQAAAPTALRTGRPAVGDSVVGPVAMTRIAAIAVPVRIGSSTEHVLLTPIGTPRIETFLDRVELPEGWSASLQDGNAQLLGRRPQATANGASESGRRYVTAIEGTHWSVVIEESARQYQAPAKSAALTLALAILGATLFGLGASTLAGRQLARSLASLAESSDAGPPGPAIAEVSATRRRLEESARERAQAEAELRRSVSTLRAIFDGLGDAVIQTDPQRRISLVNKAFTTQLGYAPDEVLGRSPEFLYANPDDFDAVARLRFDPDAPDHGQVYEMCYRRRDGSEFWAESMALRIVGPDGELLGMLGVHRDISARRQAQALLQRSRAQLTAFVSQTPHAIAMFDRGMNYIATSRAWLAEFGNGRDDLAGLNHYEVVPDIPARWHEAHRRGLAGETLHEVADHWLDRRGRERWMRWTIVPWTDENGAIGGIILSTEDTTQQRLAEREMRELHERFAAVFRTTPVGIAILRLADGQVVEVNPALEQLIGRPREELLGRDTRQIELWVTEADRLAMRSTLEQVGVLQGGQTQFRHRDGSILDVSLSGRIVDIGGVTHLVAMAMDITAQRRAQRALELHQAQLETLVAQRTAELQAARDTLAERAAAIADLYDRAPCGYHSLDPQGRVVEVNRTELDMLGYTREEFLGRPIADFMTDASREVFRERFAALHHTGRLRDLEYDFIRKDGSVLPVLVSADLQYATDGSALGKRATMVDNSERKARQREIEAMQSELAERARQAETANRAKSAFLANMSHEIRTPINGILGLTHLLLRDTRDEAQRNRLGKVDDAARQLLQLINDVLDLSKIEAGKMDLVCADFALDEVLAGAVKMVEARAQEQGLELILHTDHVPQRLRGDTTRLSQALLNLLSNAVKFTRQGWIRLRAEIVRAEPQRVLLRFEVQDTGEGIALQRQGQLFNAFEQADSSTTRRHGGTGLGLALTRHIAEMMGGQVGVDSQPGLGSRFWFSAWLDCGEPQAAPAPAGLSGRRALLVDDLAPAREALRHALGRFGLEVQAVADVQAAERCLAEAAATGRAFDVLLVDRQLGTTSGAQALQDLRARLGAPVPQSVLLSISDDAALWSEASAVDFDAVLVKPVTDSALRETLLRLFDTPAPDADPADAAAADLAPPDADALRRLGGRRVLVAEDNPINQEVARELLRAVGLQVDVVDDGEQAVAQALAHPYDLILMDMQMPHLDGLGATRAIRARAGAALPIVAMTANAFGEDREACIAAGMNDHVAKPVDPQRLYATLLRWMPAAPPAAAAPEDALAQLEGFELERALRNVGGKRTALQRVLTSFVTAYRAGVPELLSEPHPRALPGWRRQLHSLRGSCATLGAAGLQSDIEALERALTDPAEAIDLVGAGARLQRLDAQLKDFCERVAAALEH